MIFKAAINKTNHKCPAKRSQKSLRRKLVPIPPHSYCTGEFQFDTASAHSHLLPANSYGGIKLRFNHCDLQIGDLD